MADGQPSTEVDPNALNTFAQALGETTSTLAQQALREMPSLAGELAMDLSTLNEGVEFRNHHLDVAQQFVTFLRDATAGVGALADAANTIALDYTTVDDLNASRLLNLNTGGDYSPAKLLGLYNITGSSAQVNATVDDVDDAFAPARADDYNPVLGMFHGYGTGNVPEQPATPAAKALVRLKSDPVQQTLATWQAERDTEQARKDAVKASKSAAAQRASTYHEQHEVLSTKLPQDKGPAVPILDAQGRPFQIPADRSDQTEVKDADKVHEPGLYDGLDVGALEKRLTVVANPPADDTPGGR
ncbi:hypothetical protein [Dactylosporangium sp. CA-092794]|uniref:hypothetical protein n=1 Tax=Dactylosporangium sp. CA-092794 TaxID=3239929 RepID=UPI003D8CE7C6